MKTATAPARPTARAAGTQPTDLPPVDFDTRLTLASIFMDVVLGSHPAVREARQAVADAIAAVDRYAAEAQRLNGALAAPQTFRSHPILKRAGDIVRDRGWAQHAFTGHQGAVCALQAVRLAAGGNERGAADAVSVLLDRIRHEFADGASSVPGWNDRRDRTQGDVLRLLF